MGAKQQYIDLYAENKDLIQQHSSDVMNKHREQAFADFNRMGFPTQKQEEYKYTNVDKLFEPDSMNVEELIDRQIDEMIEELEYSGDFYGMGGMTLI